MSTPTAPASLRARRLAREVGLREQARALGVDPTYLSRIERGALTPSVPRMLAIAAAYDIDCGELPGLWVSRGDDAEAPL